MQKINITRKCVACKGDGCGFCAGSGADMSAVLAFQALIPGIILQLPKKEVRNG